jgi:hypothetical protein
MMVERGLRTRFLRVRKSRFTWRLVRDDSLYLARATPP